jgi:prepilin-type N-terminal cleavage/methylation domain-containing protein
MLPLSQRRRTKGFTLIELIMTIVVVGLIAVPLSLSLTAQVQGMVKSGAYTAALNLARFEMERVNNLAYAGITSASFPNYQGYPYDVNRSVTYAQGNDSSLESLKQVTVNVTPAGSSTVLVSLTVYIAKNVSYGL